LGVRRTGVSQEVCVIAAVFSLDLSLSLFSSLSLSLGSLSCFPAAFDLPSYYVLVQ
jgi:hypothetical protein